MEIPLMNNGIKDNEINDGAIEHYLYSVFLSEQLLKHRFLLRKRSLNKTRPQ